VDARRSFVLAFSVVCCALASQWGNADPPDKPKVRPVPFRDSDGPPLAMVQRGQLTWLGDFDKDGNFIRHPTCSPGLGGAGGSGLPRFVYCMSPEWLVYEHRSGRVVKGTMVRKPFGVVVPEIGSTIIDIKDVDLKKPDRAVWNMPEVMPAYVAERIRKHGDNPEPKAPEPPKAGTPAGWKFTPFSKLDTDLLGRKVQPGQLLKHARAIGDVVEFGHLSDEGEFIPDPDLPVVSRAGILGPVAFDPWAVPRYYTVPRLDKDQKVRSVPTYEYRSGRLIRGDLHESGNFVPELGSKVIDFKDFDPEKEPQRRIYNLPGELKKTE
jgi:hypothetical protein